MTVLKKAILGVALTIFSSAPAIAGSLYNVSISVNKTEADGGKWDGFGPYSDPDLVICLSEAQRQTCLGRINDSLDYVNSDCEDELNCNFSSAVYIAGDTVNVRIYDEDTGPDDTVGIGRCNVPSTGCVIGLGRVNISYSGQ